MLTWDSPPHAVAHFGLYRSEDGGQTWGSVASPTSGERAFTDGGLVNGTEYIYYLTSWDLEGFEGGPGALATATPEPGLCTVTCQAQGPVTAVPGSAASFAATAAQASCLGSLTYDWNFGDGSAHEAALSPAHIYATAGTYVWTFTATADSTSCTKSGTITVAVPPQITDVKRAASPFRIILTGSGIHADVAVYVGGQRWTTFKVVPETKVTLKGSTLKSAFPPNTFVPIRLVNGDGGETTVSYNRSTGEWH
jgi:PKD repeat protein